MEKFQAMNTSHTLTPIPKPESGCFACGQTNPSGLHMQFQSDGSRLYSTLTPDLHFRGWHNLLHGGVISTILDEIMAWAAIHFLEKFPLSKSIQVEFFRPTYVHQEITASGWLKEWTGKKEVLMHGRLQDHTGETLARSEGRLALADPDSRLFRRIIPEDMAREMQMIFRNKPAPSETPGS
jgi:acyl-coenzyme A thioesterase PaaI-like protein